MSGQHWLASTLVRAGVDRADVLTILPGDSLDDAWRAARTTLAVSDEELARHIASRFHLRLADVSGASPTAARLVPESLVRRHNVLPLREDDREIIAATADPTDLEAEQAVAFASGRQVVFEVAPPDRIRSEIERRYAPHGTVASLVQRVDSGRADAVRVVDGMAGAVARADGGESAAVVKLTNLILRAAIDHGAAAFEIAPDATGGAVHLRLDGVWLRFMPLPVPALRHVVARLRVLGNLGIANRAWSGSGGARLRIEGRTYDLRVRVSDDAAELRATVHIFDQQQRPLPADLGLDDTTLDRLRDLLAGAGPVVVAGPPGSGVARLHSALLRRLARDGRDVALVEDGLRWDLHGVQHGTLSEVAAGNFDVIGVAVENAPDVPRAVLEAARPGRLILLRTAAPDAAAVLRGLRGAADPAIPCTILSLRRVRTPCDACAGAGCERCLRTGYRGSVPLLAIVTERNVEDEPLLLARAGDRLVADGRTTAAEVRRALGPHDDAPAGPRPTRVLVADDDPLIRLLAHTVLEADGLAAVDAEDGLDALEKIGQDPGIALVVLDLDMPRLDGHGVLARLRGDVRTAALPVVVLTASANPADETRALERGADDYIRKPIDPPRFQARVRAVLRRVRG